jgi:biopolymer transport protein ExbD
VKARHFVALALILAGCGHAGGSRHVDITMPEALNEIRIGGSGPVVIIGHDRTRDLDTIQLEGDTVEPTALCSKFPTYRDEANGVVIIKAAPEVKYGTVLRVIAAAQHAGFTKFGFANKVRGGVVNELGGPPGFNKSIPKPTPRNLLVLIDYGHRLDAEVSGTNRIWIDGKSTTISRLYHDMGQAIAYHRNHAAEAYSTHVLLYGDPATSWDSIIKILDAARQSGDDDIELIPNILRNGKPLDACPG